MVEDEEPEIRGADLSLVDAFFNRVPSLIWFSIALRSAPDEDPFPPDDGNLGPEGPNDATGAGGGGGGGGWGAMTNVTDVGPFRLMLIELGFGGVDWIDTFLSKTNNFYGRQESSALI